MTTEELEHGKICFDAICKMEGMEDQFDKSRDVIMNHTDLFIKNCVTLLKNITSN